MIESLKLSPIAIETRAANEQHYELPTEFFKLCLGKRLKYSSAFYPTGLETLDQAEDIMLRRAEKAAAKGDTLVSILLLAGLRDTYPCEKPESR